MLEGFGRWFGQGSRRRTPGRAGIAFVSLLTLRAGWTGNTLYALRALHAGVALLALGASRSLRAGIALFSLLALRAGRPGGTGIALVAFFTLQLWKWSTTSPRCWR